MTKITKQQVLDTLAAIIEEDPTRSNRGECCYVTVDDDRVLQPLCIVAETLVRFDVPLQAMVAYNNARARQLKVLLNLAIEPDALDLLSDLQTVADAKTDDAYPSGQTPWKIVLEQVMNP